MGGSRVGRGAESDQSTTERRWNTVLTVAASVIVASPVVLNPAGFDQFQLPTLCVQAVATVIAIAAVLVTRGPIVHRAFVPLAALLAVLALATLLSDAVGVSFVGTPARRFGLLQWLVLAGAFVVGSAFADPGRRRVLLAVLLSSSSAVAAYAVVQRAGWDPFDQSGASTTLRPGSTFGSAAFLGGYLAAVVAVGTSVIVSRLMSWRWLAPVLALDAVALVLTQSRAAWIGAAFGSVLAIAWNVRRDPGLRPVAIRTVGVGALVVLITAVSVPGIVGRAGTLASPTEGTAGGRLELAQMGLGAVWERPVLGWGPDLSRAAMREQIGGDFERDYGDERIEDRAHNAALDLAVFGGLPALAAAMWLIVSVVRSGWARRGERSARAVMVGLLAFAGHLAFNFPVPELDVVLWLLAGTLVSARSFDGVRVPSFLAGGLAGVLVIVTLVASIDALAADRSLRLGVDRENAGDVVGAGERYADVQRATPDSSRAHEVRARWLLRVGEPFEAVTAARRAVAADASDPYQREVLARALNAAALDPRGDPRFADEAATIAGELIASSPNDGSAYLELGTARAAQGRLDEAEASYLQAAELIPRRSEPLRNLGLLAGELGDVVEAVRLLCAAIDIDPADATAAAALGRLGNGEC